jgi:hypothetical protein
MIATARTVLGFARAGAEWAVAHAGEAIGLVGPHGLMVPDESSDFMARGAADRSFSTEAEMLPTLSKFVQSEWIAPHPAQTWVILEEQRMHSRIADLVIVRLDVEVLRARQDGDWLRPLRLTELRVIAGLRGDRTTSPAAVARKAGLEPANALRVLQSLAADGFIVRQGKGYRRLAPGSALTQRVVSFEMKRSEPRRALSQARAHRPWADETYVAFDARFAARFESFKEQYARAGVGLIELRSDELKVRLRSRARRRANRLEAALIGEQALARMLGLPAGDRPERRLPHGHRISGDTEPIIIGAESNWVKTLRWAGQAE